MNVLDLFSGIGGFSLGLERAGMRTVAFCECEPFPQCVLKKNFPGVPVYDDVHTLTAERLRADGIDRIDVITGGYPCQPFSLAGKRMGQEDDRHLWPEMHRIIQECRPAWVVGENVVGHISMGLDTVLADLEDAGYEAQPFIIPAASVGAPHLRDRVWIIANSIRDGGWPDFEERISEGGIIAGGYRQDVADSEIGSQWSGLCSCESEGVGRGRSCDGSCKNASCTSFGGSTICRLGRNSHGVSDWMDADRTDRLAVGQKNRNLRLKALGNSVVPQILEIIGRAILAVSKQ